MKKRDFLLVYQSKSKPRKRIAISLNSLPKYLSENRVKQVVDNLKKMGTDKLRIGLYDEGLIDVYRR